MMALRCDHIHGSPLAASPDKLFFQRIDLSFKPFKFNARRRQH
jgi:hypothetical protein